MNLLNFVVAAATQNWPAAATALTGSPLAGTAVGTLQSAIGSPGPGANQPMGTEDSLSKEQPQASPEMEKKQDPSGQGLPNKVGEPQSTGKEQAPQQTPQDMTKPTPEAQPLGTPLGHQNPFLTPGLFPPAPIPFGMPTPAAQVPTFSWWGR